jgi:hypothetical protein
MASSSWLTILRSLFGILAMASSCCSELRCQFTNYGASLRNALNSYDLLGRLAAQSDYGGIAGISGPTYSRSLTYNARGHITL